MNGVVVGVGVEGVVIGVVVGVVIGVVVEDVEGVDVVVPTSSTHICKTG